MLIRNCASGSWENTNWLPARTPSQSWRMRTKDGPRKTKTSSPGQRRRAKSGIDPRQLKRSEYRRGQAPRDRSLLAKSNGWGQILTNMDSIRQSCVMNSTTPNPPATTPPTSPPKTNWPLFCGILLAPPVLTMVFGLEGVWKYGGEIAIPIAIYGSGISGLICGTMLARRSGRSLVTRIVLGIFFAVGIGIACLA